MSEKLGGKMQILITCKMITFIMLLSFRNLCYQYTAVLGLALSL